MDGFAGATYGFAGPMRGLAAYYEGLAGPVGACAGGLFMAVLSLHLARPRYGGADAYTQWNNGNNYRSNDPTFPVPARRTGSAQ